MKPIEFPEQTAILAEHQEGYRNLPVFQSDEEGKKVISCWKFTLWERVRILFGAKLWIQQLTFGNLFQPQLPELDRPFEREK